MNASKYQFRYDNQPGQPSPSYRLRVLDSDRGPEFTNITKLVELVFEVPVAAISLIDRRGRWFKSFAGIESLHTPGEVAFCDHTIGSTDGLMVSDTSLDARFCNHPAVSGQPGIRSYLGTPIIGTDGQILGALCAVDFKPRSFTPDQQRLLATFADLVMNEFELRQVASVDALTGLATRRAFVEKLETVARWDTKASLICVDLDRFKAINDTYGHPVGDDVLRTVSRAIMDCCDVNAFAGRLGGEELAVVLSGTDGIEAAERIRRAIEQARVARFPDLTFTASVGVASRMPGMDQHAWLAAADAALYDAKKSGRNCVRYSVPALSGV